jgi:hypothetical protein
MKIKTWIMFDRKMWEKVAEAGKRESTDALAKWRKKGT